MNMMIIVEEIIHGKINSVTVTPYQEPTGKRD